MDVMRRRKKNREVEKKRGEQRAQANIFFRVCGGRPKRLVVVSHALLVTLLPLTDQMHQICPFGATLTTKWLFNDYRCLLIKIQQTYFTMKSKNRIGKDSFFDQYIYTNIYTFVSFIQKKVKTKLIVYLKCLNSTTDNAR